MALPGVLITLDSRGHSLITRIIEARGLSRLKSADTLYL